MSKYEWRKGYRHNGVKADTVGAVIEQLSDKNNGNVTPEAIVQEAARMASPLRKLFTWSDTEAAREHRLNEARRMLGALVVRVQIQEPDGKMSDEPVRAWVNVCGRDEEQQGGRVYIRMDTAMSSADLADQVIDEALQQLLAWQRRYHVYRSMRDAAAYVQKAGDVLRKKRGRRKKD